MKRLPTSLMLLIWGLIVADVYASTIIPPSDYGAMVRLSDVVIKVEIGESTPFVYGGLLYTRTSVTVIQAFKGDFKSGDGVEVVHLGGVIDKAMAVVPGGASMVPGERMLLSLRNTAHGLSLWLLGYGQLRIREFPDGTEVYEPLDTIHELSYDQGLHGAVEVPGVYRSARLENHITALLAGDVFWDARSAGIIHFVATDVLTAKGSSDGIVLPAGCSMLNANGTFARWHHLSNAGALNVFTQTASTTTERVAIQQAVKNWGDIPGTSLGNVAFGGAKDLPHCDASGVLNPLRASLNDDELFVAYNDPCGNLDPTSSCVGILATAQHYVSTDTHVHREGEWASLTKGIVVVNKGVESCLTATRFQQMIQHEIGHLLGFGHHTIEPSNMNASCCNPTTAKDVACAQFVYSTMALNPTPVIAKITPDSVPQGSTVSVTIDGAGFMPESVVAIGGTDVQIQQVNFIHANRMEATVVILQSAIPSSRAFRVMNPTPGGGRSQDMAFTVTTSTAIPDTDENGVPYRFRLGDNYPNPFNPSTVIPFEIPWHTWVNLSLIDASGRTLRTLIDRDMHAGRYRYQFEGDRLSSGLYLVRITTDSGFIVKKISFIK